MSESGGVMSGANVARARRNDRGAVAVEFAIVLPLLIILVFGIIDFGRVFFAQITVTQAAREGARLSALGLPNVQSRTTAAAAGLSPVMVTNPSICPTGSTQATDAVVTVTYTFEFSTPLIEMVGLPATKVLTGRGHMPCQG